MAAKRKAKRKAKRATKRKATKGKRVGRPPAGTKDPKTRRQRAVMEDYEAAFLRLPPEEKRKAVKAAAREGLNLSDYFMERTRTRDSVLAEVGRRLDEQFAKMHRGVMATVREHLKRIEGLPDRAAREQRAALKEQAAELEAHFNEVYRRALAAEVERAVEDLEAGRIQGPDDVRIATDAPDEQDDLLPADAMPDIRDDSDFLELLELDVERFELARLLETLSPSGRRAFRRVLRAHARANGWTAEQRRLLGDEGEAA